MGKKKLTEKEIREQHVQTQIKYASVALARYSKRHGEPSEDVVSKLMFLIENAGDGFRDDKHVYKAIQKLVAAEKKQLKQN